MKRKIATFFMLVLVCGVYFVYRHSSRIENRILRNVAFNNEDFVSIANDFCLVHKYPVVIEYCEYSNPPDTPPRISYSAEKTTLRELLDAVVPQKDFIWTTNGKVIHIISRKLASRPDYPMNTVIGRFSAKNVDRNILINSAVARARKGNAPEPLVYGEFPFKRFNYRFDPPKISIDMEHATLREVLDEISLKADFCYTVERAQNHDVLFPSVPVGSYALWIMLWQDWQRPNIPATEQETSKK